MTEPTIDLRIDIWRAAYSRASLLQAKGIADILLTIQPTISINHRVGLLTGLVVTYARPFTFAQITKKQRIIPMYDVEIPEEHRDLHETFMEMRNTIFGHKDATGPTIGNGVMNQIQFVVKEGFLDLHTVTPGYYDHGKLKQATTLCDRLVAFLEMRLNGLMERCPFPTIKQDGAFVMNIDDPNRPWVVNS